jgi:hypothetical protein
MLVTKWILSGIGSVMVPICPDVFLEFHFRAPKNWKSENLRLRPASGVLEIGPECRRLRGQGVRMPEAERREKLRIWRPGVASQVEVLRVVREFGVPGWQKFPKADPHELMASGSYC